MSRLFRAMVAASLIWLIAAPTVGAQDGRPPTPQPTPDAVTEAQARATQMALEAREAEERASLEQLEAAAAVRRAQAARVAAEQARLEAEQAALTATLADAQAALGRADDVLRQAELLEAEAMAALERSAAAVADARIASVRADQAAIEAARLSGELSSTRTILAAEREMTMWLTGALLLVSVSAIAGLALVVRVMRRSAAVRIQAAPSVLQDGLGGARRPTGVLYVDPGVGRDAVDALDRLFYGGQDGPESGFAAH